MKKVLAIISVSVLLIASIFGVEINLLKLIYNKNMKESEEILKIAYTSIKNTDNDNISDNIWQERFVSKIIKDNIINEVSNNTSNLNKIVMDNVDIVGILEIPKLQIEAPIRDGTSQEVMRTSIGHFVESDYWEGNVSFASHNSGTSAHYFESINTLDIDDEIDYITKLGIKRYKVQSIQQIDSTDWSMVIKNNQQSQNKENTITLITCIKGQPNSRLCVRGVEV